MISSLGSDFLTVLQTAVTCLLWPSDTGIVYGLLEGKVRFLFLHQGQNMSRTWVHPRVKGRLHTSSFVFPVGSFSQHKHQQVVQHLHHRLVCHLPGFKVKNLLLGERLFAGC